jgi:RimJ/RimL family protein N-acetyltransferase
VIIPTLETPRLKLRAHTLGDLDALKKMWADPLVVKFISGVPSTEQQSWARLMSYLGHWQLLGFGYWAIEEKSTGNYIGEIGLADFKREIHPPISNPLEAGWILSSPAHGKGYATEALKKVLQWADEERSVDKTVCIITNDNQRSITLAESCGYVKTSDTIFNEKPVSIFTRLRS